MAIGQYEKMMINKYLNDYPVSSFEELIPNGKMVNLDEFLSILLKFFDKAMETKRKEVYIQNILTGISTLVDELSDSGYGVADEHIQEIIRIGEVYREYAKKYEIVNSSIDNIVEHLDSLVFTTSKDESEEEAEEVEEDEVSEEEKKDAIIENIANSFTSLNKENDDLRSQLEELKKMRKSLEKSLNTKNKMLDAAQKENREIRSKQKNNEQRIASLDKAKTRLEARVTEQDRLLSDRESLLKTNEQQKKDLAKANEIINDFRQKERLISNRNDTNRLRDYTLAKNLIVEYLLMRSYTLEDIEKNLVLNGYRLDRHELFAIMKEISSEYEVEKELKSDGNIIYHISTPKLASNKRIQIPTDRRCLEVMLTADWHTFTHNKKELNSIDALYNYCSKNGISLIFNLGDLVDPDLDFTLSDYRGKLSQDILKGIKDLADSLPYDKNIHEYILGGNHDEYLRRLKINAIEKLVEWRPDFYDLGYYHAFIEINDILLALHHPQKKYNGEKKYREYLKTYYNTAVDVNESEVFMDLFGHFHTYNFFPQSGYLSVPALTRDNQGAVQMSIYFDNQKRFDYVDIIPLTLKNNTLYKNKQYTYEKNKKR